MRTLSSLTLEELGFGSSLRKYENELFSEDTFISFVCRYLSSEPGFISRADSRYAESESEAECRSRIEKVTKKGQRIQVFLTAFRPKSKNPSVSGGQLMPDMSELLALTHLAMIAKRIREIYSPGFQFVVAYEGMFFRSAAGHSEEEARRAYETLSAFKSEAERLAGAANAIRLVDLDELANELGEGFRESMAREKREAREKYLAGDKASLDGIAKKIFEEGIDIREFSAEGEASEHCFEQALFGRAFKRAKYDGGLGIRGRYPDSIPASVKTKTKTRMSLQLAPGFEAFPHERLAVRGKDGLWRGETWESIGRKAFFPVYFQGIPHPLYHQET